MRMLLRFGGIFCNGPGKCGYINVVNCWHYTVPAITATLGVVEHTGRIL